MCVGGKEIITISSFGLDGRRSPSKMFCIFTLLARVWRPLHHRWCHRTAANHWARHFVDIKWDRVRTLRCCLDLLPVPSRLTFSLSVALETTRLRALLCPLWRHRKTVDLSGRFLKLKEKSKGQPLFTRTHWHVILKHVWSVVLEVCIYCHKT